MSGPDIWQEITAEERKELYPDPERVTWILSRYPESEITGRPGILIVSEHRATRKAVSGHVDEHITEVAEESVELEEFEVEV